MRERPVRRVLMFSDCIGGVWNYSLELAAALGEYGVETILLATGAVLRDDQLHSARKIDSLRVFNEPLKLEWMPGCEQDLATSDALLLELAECYEPDIVHINGYAHCAAGFSEPVVCVAHSCVPSWWSRCRGSRLPDEWYGYERRLRRGLAAAAAMVAPSRSYLTAFLALHGGAAHSITIYNGRDGRGFATGPKDSVALAAGRFWDEAKNLQLLAAAETKIRHPLRVAGAYRAQPGGGRLQMLGPLSSPALAGEMARAAVFVAPVRYEPFGLAILEAALCECALVLGDVDTMRELWDGAARFVSPDAASSTAAAVNELLDNPEQARAAGLKARQRALAFGAESMAERYLQLYGDLLACQPKSSSRRSAEMSVA